MPLTKKNNKRRSTSTPTDDGHWHGQLIELKKTVSKEVGALRGDVDKKLNKILELMEKQQMLGAHQRGSSSSGGRKR